jgi:hypothetical protein
MEEVNEYETVEFHNGSDTPLNMVWAGKSYAVCPPHSSVHVVRFVAEYYASRNAKWQLVEDSERARKIEQAKAELIGTEVTELNRRMAEAEEAKVAEEEEAEAVVRQAKKKVAKKKVVEEAEEEVEESDEE